ncbi:hypothetical protein ACJ41O_010320 [Fusarium nematophilum]
MSPSSVTGCSSPTSRPVAAGPLKPEMDALEWPIVYALFALQIWSPKVAGQDSDQRIGYYASGDTTTAFYCPQSAKFYAGEFSDDWGTYAHCDYFTTQPGRVQVGTACYDDYSVIYSDQTITGGATTALARTIDDGLYTCTTVLLYNWYDDGYGSDLRSLIDCENWIGITTSVDSLFIESPTDVPTTPTSTTDTEITSDPITTEDTSTTATGGGDAKAPDTTSSSPEPTETRDPGDGGPDAGVIAGAVVGSIAGVTLIIGGIILGFRMGRKASPQDDAEDRPKSFRDTLRSLPRPTVTWTGPEPKDAPVNSPQPIFQPTVVAEEPGTEAKLCTEQSASQVSRSDVVTPIQVSPMSPGPSAWAVHAPGARAENPGVELPADPGSQGWARTESHPLPYEIDSTAAHKPLPKPPDA